MSFIQQTVLFLTVGLLGMFSHYFKRWLQKEITGSLYKYLFVDEPRRTALALFGFVAGAGTIILENQLQGMTWQQIVMLAITTGYACDSALNKGTPP
jgi:hypothetical protein